MRNPPAGHQTGLGPSEFKFWVLAKLRGAGPGPQPCFSGG